MRCDCNGRSRYCLRDAWGLHCVDCQGNTEGRHCERCKDGFYLKGAGLSCTPCRCNPTGEKPQHTVYLSLKHSQCSGEEKLFSFINVGHLNLLRSLQGLSAPHATAGGAAAVKTASQEKSATAVQTDRSDLTAAHKGESLK